MTKKVRIGLDIGSSAVRAAEVVVDGDRRTLRRFAQVGLPAGAVVEGEVHDQAVVTAALKKLWQSGGFSGKKVVLGLGSQRAMVRQVEMPPMSDAELRSALQFKSGEFLPIPVDQAVVDFAPLSSGPDPQSGRRVLLIAAQREVVLDEVLAVEAAGLGVEAVDSSSLALLRAVSGPNGPSGGASSGSSPVGGGGGRGLEAVVGIGAELVTVAVRDAGVPRFVRTVALANSAPAASESAVMPGRTERFATGRAPGQTGLAAGRASRLDAIVGEVRSSLEYLLSQSGTGKFEQVLVTGGGAMLAGVTEALSTAVGLPVKLAELPFAVDKKALGLSGDALTESSYRWLTACGLALWGTDVYGSPTLLPPEVVAKRQQRRVVAGAVGGVVLVAACLGGVSFSRVHTADGIASQISRDNVEAVALQGKIKALGYVLEVPAEVQSRRALAVAALIGDIDWTGLLQRLAAALPGDVKLGQISLTKNEAGLGAGVPVAGSIVGSVAMSAETTGGATAVAQFIDQVSRVKGLYALWVSSTTKATGQTTIQATAQVTTAAFSNRAAALPGGTK